MPLNNQGIPPKVKLTKTVPNGHMVSPERLHSKVPESTTYGMMNVCLKSQMFLFVTVSLSEEKKKKRLFLICLWLAQFWGILSTPRVRNRFNNNLEIKRIKTGFMFLRILRISLVQ